MLLKLYFFVLITLLTTTEQCLKTIPPEEIYITSTEPLFETTTVNLCNDCDIDEIVKVRMNSEMHLDTALSYNDEGCQETSLACIRNSCRTVKFVAESGGMKVDIGDPSQIIELTLACDRDGTFSYENVKNIEVISCTCAT